MSSEEKEAYVRIVGRMYWLYEPLVEASAGFLKKARDLVDVGCGNGLLLNIIHKKYPKIELRGIDIDSYMIEQAKASFPFKFEVKDAAEFKIKSDLIISNLAFHHFKNPIELLRKLRSLSKKALIISDQIRPSTEKELEKRLSIRKNFINDSLFYDKNERASILESYSRTEIMEMVKQCKMKYKILFFNNDYYERFVVIFS